MIQNACVLFGIYEFHTLLSALPPYITLFFSLSFSLSISIFFYLCLSRLKLSPSSLFAWIKIFFFLTFVWVTDKWTFLSFPFLKIKRHFHSVGWKKSPPHAAKKNEKENSKQKLIHIYICFHKNSVQTKSMKLKRKMWYFIHPNIFFLLSPSLIMQKALWNRWQLGFAENIFELIMLNFKPQ